MISRRSRRAIPSFALWVQGAAAANQVPVAFWNRSGRTVTLRIDGQSRVLAPGKGLTLDLPREFVWQSDGRESRTERVSADAPAYEIVIRQ